MIAFRFRPLLVCAALMVSSATAFADALPPPGDCAHKVEGQACTDETGKAGACGKVPYTRSFTPPTPGAKTETSQSSYFGCVAGATPTKSGKSCSVSDVGTRSDAGGSSLLMIAIVMGGVLRRKPR